MYGQQQQQQQRGALPPGAVQQTSPLEGGIRFELEEVESRYEEYPETLAFVRLLCELVSRSPVSMLIKLGSSYRAGMSAITNIFYLHVLLCACLWI